MSYDVNIIFEVLQKHVSNFKFCKIGQAARHGVRENDKIVTINGKTPRNVDDAVSVIKQAGNQIKLVVLREEDLTEEEANWARDSMVRIEISVLSWVSGMI